MHRTRTERASKCNASKQSTIDSSITDRDGNVSEKFQRSKMKKVRRNKKLSMISVFHLKAMILNDAIVGVSDDLLERTQVSIMTVKRIRPSQKFQRRYHG